MDNIFAGLFILDFDFFIRKVETGAVNFNKSNLS